MHVQKDFQSLQTQYCTDTKFGIRENVQLG